MPRFLDSSSISLPSSSEMSQRVVRGLTAGLNSSRRYTFRDPDFEVDYLVVGGGECQPPAASRSDRRIGVVGLAIARSLALKRPDASTYLIERHARTGEETR